MAASGFFRSNEEARLKDISTMTAVSGRSKAERSSTVRRIGTAPIGGGTTRTRPGAIVSIAAAVKRDGTHISCTNCNPACQSGGTLGNSHAQ